MIMTKNVTPYQAYAAATITVSGGVTDFNVNQNSSLFSKVSVPTEILIRNGASPLIIKFNAPAHDSVALPANSVLNFSGLIISNIYVTNTEATTTMEVFTLGSA